MTEKYQEQLKIEKLNKEIAENIIENRADELIEFYKKHSKKETLLKFDIRTDKQLAKILKDIGYDFSYQKKLLKGKPSARDHKSYLDGGKKSSETQKLAWQNKSTSEKLAWSEKQSLAHSTKTYANIKAFQNKEYRDSLSKEENDKQNQLRSASMKEVWENLSEEEKNRWINNFLSSKPKYEIRDSKPNLEFKEKLEKLGLREGIDFSREFYLNKRFYDFKIGKNLIEIDPTITHNSTWTPFKNSTPVDKYYHRDKMILAKNNGYHCINIFDWDDKDKIINTFILPKERLFARNCDIKEVSKEEAKSFIDHYHLQGYANDKIRIGLYYNNLLISIMTFGKPRYNRKYEYELIRYCSSCSIIGGGEKIFNYFIKKYNPSSIISYCDLSKFNGNIYDKLKFRLLRISTPSCHWYNLKTHQHITDNLLRQQGFSRLVNHCEAKKDCLLTNNNKQLMIEAGFVEVYDCGQSTYIWEKTN